jgi:predicted metal-dependent HD superfamily phosphohydrolase
VRLTATHDVTDGDRDGAVLCDADLAVLASGPVRYSSYVEGVRREYGHLDDATFARGRSAVLRRLLDRPALFRTAYGRREWEAAARANVTAELAGLAEG